MKTFPLQVPGPVCLARTFPSQSWAFGGAVEGTAPRPCSVPLTTSLGEGLGRGGGALAVGGPASDTHTPRSSQAAGKPTMRRPGGPRARKMDQIRLTLLVQPEWRGVGCEPCGAFEGGHTGPQVRGVHPLGGPLGCCRSQDHAIFPSRPPSCDHSRSRPRQRQSELQPKESGDQVALSHRPPPPPLLASPLST